MSEETHTEPAEQPATPAAETDATPKVTATPAPSEEQQGGDAPAEPTQSEIAAKMREEYCLKSEDDVKGTAEDSSAVEEKGGDGKEDENAPFQLEFSEGTQIDAGLVGIATKHFKELGATGAAAGACMERIIAEFQEQEYARMAQADAQLKVDWGSEYGARKAEVDNYLRAFCKRQGVSVEAVSGLGSPMGKRLVYDLMETSGLASAPAAGLNRQLSGDDIAWADAVINDPNHPDYKAYREMSNRTKWQEVSDKLNRVLKYKMDMGLS